MFSGFSLFWYLVFLLRFCFVFFLLFSVFLLLLLLLFIFCFVFFVCFSLSVFFLPFLSLFFFLCRYFVIFAGVFKSLPFGVNDAKSGFLQTSGSFGIYQKKTTRTR